MRLVVPVLMAVFGGVFVAPAVSQELPGKAAGWLHCTSFSPDGKWLATITAGEGSLGAVTLYDVQSRQIARSLPVAGARGSAGGLCLAFSADGKYLAADTADGLSIWDTGTWERNRLALDKGVAGSSRQIQAIEFSHDGRQLAAYYIGGSKAENVVRLWKVATREVAATLVVGGRCFSMTFSPDGSELRCAVEQPARAKGKRELYECHVQTWDLSSGKLTKDLTGYVQWERQEIRKVTWRKPGADYVWRLSPDGSVLVASVIGELAAFQVESKRGGSLGQHQAQISSLAISPDNRLAVSGAVYSTEIRLWNLASGELVRTFEMTPQPDFSDQTPAAMRGLTRSVAISADGKHVAATTYGEDGHSVFLWEAGP